MVGQCPACPIGRAVAGYRLAFSPKLALKCLLASLKSLARPHFHCKVFFSFEASRNLRFRCRPSNQLPKTDLYFLLEMARGTPHHLKFKKIQCILLRIPIRIPVALSPHNLLRTIIGLRHFLHVNAYVHDYVCVFVCACVCVRLRVCFLFRRLKYQRHRETGQSHMPFFSTSA